MEVKKRIKAETDRQRMAQRLGDAANNLDTAHDLRFEVQVPVNAPIPDTSHRLIASIQAEYGIMILLQIVVLMAIAFRRR
jgi:hypothetical protein